MIERTPTEVSNRSSDDETQPKPKDTKNNEKKGTYLTLLASEYLNSKEVSTMYFLICWGHFISKIALLQYVIGIAFLGWSLSFTIKDPTKKQYLIGIGFLGGL